MTQTKRNNDYHNIVLEAIKKHALERKWISYKDITAEELTQTITVTVPKSSFWKIIEDLEKKELIIVKRKTKRGNTKVFCLNNDNDDGYFNPT